MIAVVVPWRAGCPHRTRAWEHVRAHLAVSAPDATIIEAHAPAGEWCKAAAVNPAVRELPAGTIVVLHDADVIVPGLHLAVEAVGAGAAWAVPHHNVHRLTQAATARVLSGGAPDLDAVERRPYQGVEGGGVTVLRHDVALDVPLDTRFTGWGQEDHSFGIALHHLHGRAWRGSDPLIHLWHPPQQRMDTRYGSPASHQLFRRYTKARRDPAAMRALLEEAKTT